MEIYSKVFVVLDKYFSQKMPRERVAKVCMSISAFINRIQQNTCFFNEVLSSVSCLNNK